ncbi:class I SAM-dependent methyltransferase [Flavobacterium sp. AED]|uniref:class I SAM-dependent methyltransferase n=1 Tax=Flavobacterium sp. AED TaxID=1423323 RepID=UPI00057EE85D|nr:class I SAM-dependent methyltransferase [Flavobacterium sp. AED]KIA85775.1 SAM-dependent methyltransferase [Flavobacterium sp. AED]MDI1303946.1 class I SAM-dependent methyltransferase [bacterium]
MEINKKNHWETVYETKQPNEVSWTQENPKISLDFIRQTNLGKSAKIIDIGGGDSKLVDFLLEDGYENITVLDISANALERVKIRLGKKAEKVTWIVSDITEFKPITTYDIWHDRATFHFLTSDAPINSYIKIAEKWISSFLIIGTFSDKGPMKCSGLEIKQYTETTLENQFQATFEKLKCINEDHITPFETTQNFIFCVFRKR